MNIAMDLENKMENKIMKFSTIIPYEGPLEIRVHAFGWESGMPFLKISINFGDEMKFKRDINNKWWDEKELIIRDEEAAFLNQVFESETKNFKPNKE